MRAIVRRKCCMQKLSPAHTPAWQFFYGGGKSTKNKVRCKRQYCRLNRTLNTDFPPPEKNCHAGVCAGDSFCMPNLRRTTARNHSSIHLKRQYCRLNRTLNTDFPPPEKNCMQKLSPAHTPGCSFPPAVESPRSKFDANHSMNADFPLPEKSCMQKLSPARPTDLCFSICRFSQVVFIPRAQPHAQSLFLFPIVFGMNLIRFFDEKDGAAGNSIVCFGASIPCHPI